MRPILMLTIALLLPSVCRADDKAEWKKLLGDWKIVSAKQGGKDIQKFKSGSVKIEQGKFTITVEVDDGYQTRATDIKIDFSKSPKQIDLSRDGKEPTSHGIIKQEGEKLTVCFDSTRRDRPQKFEVEEGSRVKSLVFERIKKKK